MPLRIRVDPRVVALALFLLVLPSCDGLVCTARGCGDTVDVRVEGVDFEQEFALTLHAEGVDPVPLQCDSVSGRCFPLGFLGEDFQPDDVTLVLELEDTTITRTFELRYRSEYPNGRSCGPECRNARITFVVE